MPRIKAYKGARNIIPVDEAKVATAFRCPWTRKVYGNKRDYVKHLAWLRENRMHRRIRENVRLRKKQDLWNQPTFKDIIDWIEMNPEFMFDQGFRTGWTDDQHKSLRDQFWLRITYLDLRWSNNASNSHSCPRGGKTNWGGREMDREGNPLPHGYPGFTGRIEYQVSHDIGFGSDFMRELGIHTGSGGGIKSNQFGYSVTFFDADWPGLVSNRVMDLLANRDWQFFRWGEPNYFRQ